MSHPYTDPWHNMAAVTPTQMLTNRAMWRKSPGSGSGGGGSAPMSPLTGLGEAAGAVLASAGYGRTREPAEPVQSDADPPTQAVQSDGSDLYHNRANGDGTTTSTHLGPDDMQSTGTAVNP